jgi:hypothetical protein
VQGQSQVSDIDKYFDCSLVYTSIADNDDPMWLCKWSHGGIDTDTAIRCEDNVMSKC